MLSVIPDCATEESIRSRCTVAERKGCLSEDCTVSRISPEDGAGWANKVTDQQNPSSKNIVLMQLKKLIYQNLPKDGRAFVPTVIFN